MKQITILRMRPGAETQAKALELFLTHGTTRETEWVMASTNSQTYISLGDITDDADLAGIHRLVGTLTAGNRARTGPENGEWGSADGKIPV